MKNKWLHAFKINRKVERKVTEDKKDENGENIEVTKTVTDDVLVEFLLKKPNRKLYDEAELFYGVKMSEGIKAGLLTRNLLAKRYEDDGGAFSETEKERYAELYTEIYNKENEYQRLQLNLDNKSQPRKDELADGIIGELAELRRELVEIENSQSNIFDQTAENRAKNQTIMWWVLQLAHWKEHDHETGKSFFEGKGYDERLNSYDEYEDSDDDFLNEAIRKLAFFISFWYMGRATSSEDFVAVEELYEEQNPSEEVEELEEAEAAQETAEEAEESKQAKTKSKAKKTRAKKAAKKKEPEEAVEAAKEEVAEEAEAKVTSETSSAPTAETDKSLTNEGEPNDE
jgi:hypothetical protein